MIKPRNYWTKEKCQEEALKYNSRGQFCKSKGAYWACIKNKWLDEVCSHMIKLINDKWTKDKCQKIIEKCYSIREFREKYNSAYQCCIRNKWINELCINLHRDFKISGYWTKEKCLESALECVSKKEFRLRYPTAYSNSLENKWINDIYDKCNFNIITNHIWMVYSYLILDKYVYVGITTNEKSRKLNHLKNSKKSAVYKFIKNNNIELKDIIYQIEINNIKDIDEIKKLEKFYLEKYLNFGYLKLNIHKTGSIGGGKLIWNKEKCQDIIKTCHSIKEFREKYNSVYNACVKNKWLNELDGLLRVGKKKGYWTKEKCQEESLKYKTKLEFQISNSFVYKVCRKNKWLNDFFPNKFNKELCILEALKYKTKKDFMKNNNKVYNLAYEHGWLNDICSHMDELKKPNGYWTKERCQEISNICKTKKDLRDKNIVVYITIMKNKWFELMSHFIELR